MTSVIQNFIVLLKELSTKTHGCIIGASLSEPHSNVENVRWSMREEPRRKTGLQHTTVVWYGGSCTNKHDKLTDTSIQVLWHCKNIRLHVLTFHIRLVRSTMHEQ